MSRRLMMAGASNIPTDGLVFHASFKNAIVAETGQALVYDDRQMIVADPVLGRKVLHNYQQIAVSADGLPRGNGPFTVSGLFRFPPEFYERWLGSGVASFAALFYWGNTPDPIGHLAGFFYILQAPKCGAILTTWGSETQKYDLESSVSNWHHWLGTHDENNLNTLYIDGLAVG